MIRRKSGKKKMHVYEKISFKIEGGKKSSSFDAGRGSLVWPESPAGEA